MIHRSASSNPAPVTARWRLSASLAFAQPLPAVTQIGKLYALAILRRAIIVIQRIEPDRAEGSG